jgi:parallel beta-helix repeat protein
MLKGKLTKGIVQDHLQDGCMYMKKQFRLLVILFVLVSGSFSIVDRTLVPAVKATYVEGPITEDTDWTLVNSPFVVSNDIILYAGATLTIEPGVEVRFGGVFSLTVEGKLVANGTRDKMIMFTSNKIDKSAGDWNAISFTGIEVSSLTYCSVEYGTGILVNGNVNIENCNLRLNLNGIDMMSGSISVKNTEIANNTLAGVNIAGGTVTLESDTIHFNGDGITLTGSSTSNITKNLINENNNAGIAMTANDFSNTFIQNNTLSANGYGFSISTDAATYITRNYILNNTVGIYYGSGINHEAHFNDICGNKFGVNASSTASASVTYNYWGSSTGPYHEGLNPRGKGDPVSGGVDFLFYLSNYIDYQNTKPHAVLWADKTLVAPNQNVTFIGADSYDDGCVDQYLFDFDDGSNSGWTTLSLFNHSYTSPVTFNYTASLKVIDDFNATSENSATTTITVQNGLSQLNVVVVLSDESVNYDENVSVSAYVSNQYGAVQNANIALFSIKGGIFSPASGTTDSAGYFNSTFAAPSVTEISNIRIVARASMPGYADASDHKYLRVLPPLMVTVTPEQSTIKSEAQTDVAVLVTLGSEIPISDALLVLSCDNGFLSATEESTDINGTQIVTFTAPKTLVGIDAVVSVTAVKAGYVMGQGQATIHVEPKALFVEASADPSAIISESSSTITVSVTSDGEPVSDATVSVSSNLGGSFDTTTETTGSNGNVTFVFNAPQVTTPDGLVGAIEVTVVKDGYVDGNGQATIAIVPKMLTVQMDVTPLLTISEATFNVSVHVAYLYDMSAVNGANVTVSYAYGETYSVEGTTDRQGNVTLSLAAPPVDTSSNITITAHAIQTGYIDGEESLTITVNPGTIEVTVKANSDIIPSGVSTIVEVYATQNSTPIANATVTMLTNYGNFTPTTGQTGPTGLCTFTYTSPETPTQLTANITASATKLGYISGQNQTSINVTPQVAAQGGGLPWLTILLIVIPVVIVVVLAVLIKTKKLVVTSEDEE